MNRTSVLFVVVVVTGFALAGGFVAGSAVADETVSEGVVLGDAADEEETTCEFPLEKEDGGGETVTVEEEPEEVVVLAPGTAQYVWEIGAQEKVTGMPVNPFTAYLDGSEDRTHVVDENGIPVEEEVVGLEPDLVIAGDIIPEESVESLRDAGLTVYHSGTLLTVEDMYGEIERIGQLVGECEGAAETRDETRATVEDITDAVADEEPTTVYYDIGFPFTVGEGTIENELLQLAGAENIALAAEEPGYFEISEEIIADNDPEWLVISEGAEVPDVTAIQESTAVEEDRIVEVNPDFVSQHGPLLVVPLEQMAEAFHPEAMAETGDPTPTPAPDDGDEADELTPTPDSDDGDDADEPTPTPAPDDGDDVTVVDEVDDDGAGFGVGVAVAALLALAFAVRVGR